MRILLSTGLFLLMCLVQSCQDSTSTKDWSNAGKVKSGKPVSVMLTAYSTTLLANGIDQALLRIAITDSMSREITTVKDSVRLYVNGKATITALDGKNLITGIDTSGSVYYASKSNESTAQYVMVAGNEPGKVLVEARSGSLWPGSHEIHLIPSDIDLKVPTEEQLTMPNRPVKKMIGADISWLPQLEDQGTTFIDQGNPVDAIRLLKNHGFNTVRLRLFVNPENTNGYAPEEGYCGLDYTLKMAKRVKDAGMMLLLDFHYSDYWADPQKQYKPERWKELDFQTLKDSVTAYTADVLSAFKKQETLPAVVQIGNEINHGLLWPDGHIGNPDQLAELLIAGVEGVEKVDPLLPVMMHIALGGQNKEAVFWLDNMIARGVEFDIIGISYYPRWHGTLLDLKNNLNDLVNRYRKPVNVVEYSDFKREIFDIVYDLPENMGNGACIWEPLNQQSGLFNHNNEVTKLIMVYDEIKEKYDL